MTSCRHVFSPHDKEVTSSYLQVPRLSKAIKGGGKGWGGEVQKPRLVHPLPPCTLYPQSSTIQPESLPFPPSSEIRSYRGTEGVLFVTFKPIPYADCLLNHHKVLHLKQKNQPHPTSKEPRRRNTIPQTYLHHWTSTDTPTSPRGNNLYCISLLLSHTHTYTDLSFFLLWVPDGTRDPIPTAKPTRPLSHTLHYTTLHRGETAVQQCSSSRRRARHFPNLLGRKTRAISKAKAKASQGNLHKPKYDAIISTTQELAARARRLHSSTRMQRRRRHQYPHPL